MSTNEPSGKRIKAQVLSGFRDHLPAQMLLRRTLIDRFRKIFESHGFEPIDTPALEHLEVLTGKAGENEKLMYHFVDHGGREVGLRYDLTVPLARFVANHQNELAMPFKRYHIAPVWRAEKAQRGRFREFYQCDADIVGAASPAADAEMLAMVAEILDAAHLPNFVIKISHRRLLEGLARAVGVPEGLAPNVFRAIDKLDKIGSGGVRTELTDTGVADAVAERLLNVLSRTGSNDQLLALVGDIAGNDDDVMAALSNLAEMFDLLNQLAPGKECFKFDLTLARGLDYYTGIVYEASVEQPKIGSVSGGGRYDGLIGTFSGRDIPAMGVSIGLERIIEVSEEFGLVTVPQSVCDVIVIYRSESFALASETAQLLRETGLNVDLSLLSNKGFGDQLKYADRRFIPLAVLLGPDEVAARTGTIKVLATGLQTTHSLAELSDAITAILASR